MKYAAFVPSLLLILLPTYGLRFEISGLPLNVLLVAACLIVGIFVLACVTSRIWREQAVAAVGSVQKLILFGAGLLAFSGVFAFHSAASFQDSLGQYLVLVILPVLLFFVNKTVARLYPESQRYFINSAVILVAFFGLVALVQYFGLYTLPEAFWGNAQEPKRALSVFGHPNFYGLFAAPLLAFAWPQVAAWFEQRVRFYCLYILAWLVGLAGVFLSLSRGAWIGLALAGVVWLIFFARGYLRKMSLVGIVIILLAVLAVPNWRYRVLLPFYGEQSASERTLLWDRATNSIAENPAWGWGWLGFPERRACNLSPVGSATDAIYAPILANCHKHPHNLWLSIWGELGALGLMAFVFIFYSAFKTSWAARRKSALAVGVFLALVTMLGHGLVDTPYFKNDLSGLFWLLLVWL